MRSKLSVRSASTRWSLGGGESPRTVSVAHATAGFLSLLGRVPELGREITADDRDVPVLVASARLASQLGKAVGDRVLVDDRPTQIVGIAAGGLELVMAPTTELLLLLPLPAEEVAEASHPPRVAAPKLSFEIGTEDAGVDVPTVTAIGVTEAVALAVSVPVALGVARSLESILQMPTSGWLPTAIGACVLIVALSLISVAGTVLRVTPLQPWQILKWK